MNHQILIIGGGAVGAFYGALLQRSGAEVTVVCRSNYGPVARDGYLIESAAFGSITFIPDHVLPDVREYGRTPDFVVVCTKVQKLSDRIALLQPVVRPGTTIVLLQNGVEIEPEIAQAFPGNEIISAVAYVTLKQTEPSKVQHSAFGHLAIGNYPSGTSEGTARLAALFQASGIRCTTTPTIALFRWQKTVWNGAVNPLSALFGGADTSTLLERAEPVLRLAMSEISAVAAATGNALAPDIVEFSIGTTRSMPRHLTSMAQDFLAQREMEIEPILGNTVRIARRHHVSVPTLESMYWLLSSLGR